MFRINLLSIMSFLSIAICAADSFLGYCYPSSGQRGTTVQVLVGGQNIGAKASLITKQPGLVLKSVKEVPSFNNIKGLQKEWLKKWLKSIHQGDLTKPAYPEAKNKEGNEKEWRKHPWFESLDQINELERSLVAKMIFTQQNPLQATPSLLRKFLLEIEILPDALLGENKIRLFSPLGVTNEKIFFIEDTPQILEPIFQPPFVASQPPVMISQIPCAVNGQIFPGECDRFRLQLQEDQAYHFAMFASVLSPFLGDTVPGHFQSVIRLLDPEGKEVLFADDNAHHPDPEVTFIPKQTGCYTLEIFDSLRRGRDDFVYHLTITQKQDKDKQKCLTGNDTYHPINQQVNADSVQLEKGIDFSLLTQGLEITGNLEPKVTKKIKLSCRQGECLVCEVWARRLDSPLDSVLCLRDSTGKIVAENDDMTQLFNLNLCRQNVDSYFMVTIPYDGDYELELSDRTQSGGADYHYRLQIRHPQPDIFAYSQHSSFPLENRITGHLMVFIDPKDNLTGPITFSCDGFRIEQKQSEVEPYKVRLTLIREQPLRGQQYCEIPLYIEAKYGNKVIRKKVIPADEVMQAFAYTHLLFADKIYAFLGKNKKAKGKK